jgi:non-ribosomal peptide synthetase-like protein
MERDGRALMVDVSVAADEREIQDIAEEAPSNGHRSADRVLVCTGYQQSVRWRAGERLHHLFEDRCDTLRANGRGGHLVVDDKGVTLTYDQLDIRANQLARHLLAQGARPGDRIALLFDQPVLCYVAMLAVLKINAAYVPLDVGFPTDRLSYIVQDSGARIVLSLSHLSERLGEVPARLVCLDEIETAVAGIEGHRLTAAETGEPVDELCYMIYTSGSTGRPKGVAIQHASICNFVRVAAEVYGLREGDRVYQGMTIAFDFSVEEIWVPLVVGATLVPKPGGSSLLGPELREFLQDSKVSALCCVPTLLATLDEDPGLRFLLVSGEACPRDLILRWHRPGRRFLNVYGPTEATVTATWTPVHPDRPVTIGVPLPTYAVVILDPDQPKALGRGEMGEIGIAGIGLASGYVNRDDLTEKAFVPDFIGIEGNPSGRIYRTGDLGRVNDEGEIEYHGRIDTQVKVRGYRIELTEIESVLLRLPGIAQAVVETYEPQAGVVELVAYYSRHKNGAVEEGAIYEQLRESLPGYMIPAYLEELDVVPMLPSGKADRKSLPAPIRRRGVAPQQAYVAPRTDSERVLAEALGQVMSVETVSVDSHFFDDLGANSLLMAQFCARVRERRELSPVSMRDVYLHPTVSSLAAALKNATPASEQPGAPAPETVMRARSSQYLLCGALQLLMFLATMYLSATLLVIGFGWTSANTGVGDLYMRSVIFGCATFLYFCTLPVVAKWLLIGRWKPQEIRIWSLAYLRFWTVKTLINTSPLRLFAGSPLYLVYLRMLGAKIGKGVVILSGSVVCTDLVTVGDGTIVRGRCFMSGYRAEGGVIRTGSVTLGRNVFVGEQTVLDIDTSLGDGAQLGHASSLHPGQSVPPGGRWHGCPAQPTDANYLTIPPARCGTLRRAAYSALQLFNLLILFGPIGTAIFVAILTEVPLLAELMAPGHEAVTRWTLYRDGLLISSALFVGGIAGGLVFVMTVPRVLHRIVTPDAVRPLYGFHYWIHRLIARMTNVRFFMDLFGDSSYVVHYLRALGYDLCRVVQTGSNFGTELSHVTPYLTRVGTGTMVSDSLWILNGDYSSTSFRTSLVSIGERNYLGNGIAFPVGAKTGDNVLFGTKTAVPIDGEVRTNVGLLGSPCFEIPRSVKRDIDQRKSPEELRQRLGAKNRYNIVTIAIFLLLTWFQLLVMTCLALTTADFYDRFGEWAVMVGTLSGVVFMIGFGVLVERAFLRFRSLKPQLCSIYDPYFWWHERLWKLGGGAQFSGTPFKNVLWRLLGVRIGRRVFDDGCSIVEKTLVTVGDDCTLNAGSVIQCHSLEDGAFKSGYTKLGAGCTLGVESFVHYGVTMGDGSVLDADSFLMKGEVVPSYAGWRGNPARELRETPALNSTGRGSQSIIGEEGPRPILRSGR